MHKYQPECAIGSTLAPIVHGRRKEPAIQEDETASVLMDNILSPPATTPSSRYSAHSFVCARSANFYD